MQYKAQNSVSDKEGGRKYVCNAGFLRILNNFIRISRNAGFLRIINNFIRISYIFYSQKESIKYERIYICKNDLINIFYVFFYSTFY